MLIITGMSSCCFIRLCVQMERSVLAYRVFVKSRLGQSRDEGNRKARMRILTFVRHYPDWVSQAGMAATEMRRRSPNSNMDCPTGNGLYPLSRTIVNNVSQAQFASCKHDDSSIDKRKNITSQKSHQGSEIHPSEILSKSFDTLSFRRF